MPPSKRKGRLCQTAGPVFMGLRVLSNMELLFKGVLEHLGEVDALFLGGGVAINDFVLVMMLGIIVGTYSSIFIAAPLVSSWHRRKERQQALPAAGQAASRK